MRIERWLGLTTSASPYALPPGAMVRQNNLQVLSPGELVPRPGMQAVYSAKDYDEVIGMYRVSNGGAVSDALIVCFKPNATTTTIKYLSPVPSGNENQWAINTVATITTTATASPTFCEDRHGRIYCFLGNGVSPLVITRDATPAQPIGLAAPTVAPSVTPAGNGYFIERVDVLDGGGSYWAPPPIVIAGGGSPTRAARLKTIIQGGAVVAVDVIDGGVGYSSPPTLTVNESGVKGVGFLAYGIIGVDPGIQGFEATTVTTGNITTGNANVTSVANIAPVKAGMNVRGTGIQSNTIVSSVNAGSSSFTMDKTASATATAQSLVINGATITGTTNASLSHGFSLTSGAVSIAYLSGGSTVGASATFDPATQRWSALLPLTPAGTSTGSGAFARFEFTPLVDGLSYGLGGSQDATWPVRPSGAFFGNSTNTMLTPTNSSPYTASDYWRDTDDNTPYQANNTGPFQSFYQQYKWQRNNHDFFAGLAPNFNVRFHKRREYEARYRSTLNGVPQNPYTLYADVYTYDYSKISLRYFTGARDQLETAADDASKWTWTTATVQVSSGQPFIDVELIPSLKTGTTPYATYAGYQTPIVRIYLKYCPDSWLNSATTGDGGYACCLGWQRVNSSGVAQLTSTNTLGWWSAGLAENGTSQRPIVDFRQGSTGGASAGIAAGTVEIIRAGTGMEQNTFFALQFDQVNCGLLYLFAQAENQFLNFYGNGSGNPYKHYQSNAAEYALDWSNFDYSPASPAYSDEYYSTYNTARGQKAFTDYRMRFYFRAGSAAPGQQGPPGPVFGEPSVLIPGTGFKTNDTATVRLRQRSNTTDPPGSATFSDGQLYTFKAVQITPATTSDKITTVTISSGGTSYYGVPELLVNGGGGYGLKLNAVVSGGAITQVNILEPGAGFTGSPTITASSQTAVLLPVLRPAMRGTYRCAYRFADWSETDVAYRTISTTSGSQTITVTDTSNLSPGLIVESTSLPFMTKIVSIVGTQVTLSAAATATVASAAATLRDMTRPIYYSDFSPITDVDTTLFTATPNATTMQWSISGVTAPARATIVEFFRTSSDESLVFYRLEMWGRVQGGTVTIQGTDTLTDEQLFDADRPFYAAVPVVLPNGNLNAYRFGIPRNDMAVCAAYGDRMWYAVSTSGVDANTILFSEYDEFESCPTINELPIQNNQKSTDSLTALVPFSTYLLAMQSSHCYAISFNTDPTVDATIQLVAHRGVLSQQCFDLFDNRLFAMDERGIYVMDRSGGVESLSEPVSNYFNLGLLDLSIRHRYFLKVDQRTNILRAFVALKGANATSPHIAFCYNLIEKAWWTESWPNGLTAACDFRRSSAFPDEPVYGAIDGDVYRFAGLVDQQYRGIASVTVTNPGSGYTAPPTITASQPGFGAEFVPILQDGRLTEIIVSQPGCGYGTYSGATFLPTVSLTVSGNATATATASLPVLASNDFPEATVPFALRTGALELVNDANLDRKNQLIDRSVTVIYRPTETSNVLQLREYFNNSISPRSNAMPRDRGTGFVHDTSGAKTTLDMAVARSPLGSATGVAKAQFAGRNYSDLAGADRHVAVELTCASAPANTGDPTPSQPLLYGLEVLGVVNGN
ncbi:MAG: hypothetical protein ACKOEM_20045 [Planctomycetia bacterium]